GIVAGRQQGGLDEAGAHRILVQVGGGVLAGQALGDRRLAGAGRADDDAEGRFGHRRASCTAARKSWAAAVTRVKSPSACHALVTALPTPTPATPAANHSATFPVVTPPAGMIGRCARGASTALAYAMPAPSVGNSLRMSAPASADSTNSVGVNAPLIVGTW